MCIYIHIYIFHIFFINSFIDGPLGCVHTLAIVNNVAMKIGLHISFQVSVSVFFGKIPRNGNAGLYGSSIFNFGGETPYCFP